MYRVWITLLNKGTLWEGQQETNKKFCFNVHFSVARQGNSPDCRTKEGKTYGYYLISMTLVHFSLLLKCYINQKLLFFSSPHQRGKKVPEDLSTVDEIRSYKPISSHAVSWMKYYWHYNSKNTMIPLMQSPLAHENLAPLMGWLC